MLMSSVDRGDFMSSFSIWMPFISLSCSVALARTFSRMLNSSGESEHPCLVPDLRGKLTIFQHWIYICCTFFHQCALLCWSSFLFLLFWMLSSLEGIGSFFFFLAMPFGFWDLSSPNQGLNLGPWQWKLEVLTTGNSQRSWIFLCSLRWSFFPPLFY